MIKISKLNSGGIIPVYRCSAACRHCLYGCSNKMNGTYITQEQSESLCETLMSMGCNSVHIGGGEPFLNFDGLLTLTDIFSRRGMIIEYIETNASWCADSFDDKKIIGMLRQLQASGAGCILISVDPFHAEFVPLKKPLRLIRLCRQAGMDYFVWKQNFIKPLSDLDDSQAYNRSQLEEALGKAYILDTARLYGLNFNGRALNIAREYLPRKDYESFLGQEPCHGLTGTHHYHADYNGFYIPPGCTGIGAELKDLKNGLSLEKYPVFNALSKGLSELYSYATAKGFSPADEGYVSKCDFCYACRKYLINQSPSADLYPDDYYRSDF